MNTTDKKIAEVLGKFGEPMAGNIWRIQGTAVIYHKTLERIAAQAGIRWDEPDVIRAERDEAVIKVTGRLGERVEWSIGEALIGVNYRVSGKQAAYVYAMAEKRGKDRTILKLIELEGYVASEQEADDLKEDWGSSVDKDRPVPPEVPDSEQILKTSRSVVHAPHTKAPAGTSGSEPESPPQSGSEPPPSEGIDFESILAEIKDQLSTVRTEKDVVDVVDLFKDDYNLMTRSQRSVVDGEAISATERVRAAEREKARQRVESAGGKGIQGYMNEDRQDEQTADGFTKEMLLDPSLINVMEETPDGDKKIQGRIVRASALTQTVQDADKFYDLLDKTRERRKKIASRDIQEDIVAIAKRTLAKFDT